MPNVLLMRVESPTAVRSSLPLRVRTELINASEGLCDFNGGGRSIWASEEKGKCNFFVINLSRHHRGQHSSRAQRGRRRRPRDLPPFAKDTRLLEGLRLRSIRRLQFFLVFFSLTPPVSIEIHAISLPFSQNLSVQTSFTPSPLLADKRKEGRNIALRLMYAI